MKTSLELLEQAAAGDAGLRELLARPCPASAAVLQALYIDRSEARALLAAAADPDLAWREPPLSGAAVAFADAAGARRAGRVLGIAPPPAAPPPAPLDWRQWRRPPPPQQPQGCAAGGGGAEPQLLTDAAGEPVPLGRLQEGGAAVDGEEWAGAWAGAALRAPGGSLGSMGEVLAVMHCMHRLMTAAAAGAAAGAPAGGGAGASDRERVAELRARLDQVPDVRLIASMAAALLAAPSPPVPPAGGAPGAADAGAAGAGGERRRPPPEQEQEQEQGRRQAPRRESPLTRAARVLAAFDNLPPGAAVDAVHGDHGHLRELASMALLWHYFQELQPPPRGAPAHTVGSTPRADTHAMRFPRCFLLPRVTDRGPVAVLRSLKGSRQLFRFNGGRAALEWHFRDHALAHWFMRDETRAIAGALDREAALAGLTPRRRNDDDSAGGGGDGGGGGGDGGGGALLPLRDALRHAARAPLYLELYTNLFPTLAEFVEAALPGWEPVRPHGGAAGGADADGWALRRRAPGRGPGAWR
ncbi:MAG: hypothetical protein J3K34DRAFT_517532 [Monoraphidium minutum]|nr:MAG: hypothetical protein J3K34DRAFT_517532 [Monoraphidium minutum]